MQKLIKVFLLSLILAVVLASCSASTAAPTVSVEKPASPTGSQPETAYPATGQDAQAVPSEAYPGPKPTEQSQDALFPPSIDVPQPAEGLGTVTGKVLEISNNEVYLAPSLILGQVVYADDPAAPPLVSYSIETDPKAVQARTGNFVFKDIQPGKYAVVVWTPGSQTLVSDRNGETVFVNVEAGMIVDLGDVFVP